MKETLSSKRRDIVYNLNWEKGYKEEDVKNFIRKCFIRMEKRLILNKIKYQDVVLIIKEEAGKELVGENK